MGIHNLAAGVALATALALSGAAQAGVVFDNGYSLSGSGGNNPEAEGNYVAQDFILAADANLTGFVFNAYTKPTSQAVTGVNLNIYTDESDAPGSLLFSGTFGVDSTAVTDTGVFGQYTLVDFHSTLPSWHLAAGSYFLALNVQPDQFDMHWTIPDPATLPGNNYISQDGSPGSFQSYYFDHSFRLEAAAAPEPAAWALMLVGFGGLGAALRGARRKAALAA